MRVCVVFCSCVFRLSILQLLLFLEPLYFFLPSRIQFVLFVLYFASLWLESCSSLSAPHAPCLSGPFGNGALCVCVLAFWKLHFTFAVCSALKFQNESISVMSVDTQRSRAHTHIAYYAYSLLFWSLSLSLCSVCNNVICVCEYVSGGMETKCYLVFNTSMEYSNWMDERESVCAATLSMHVHVHVLSCCWPWWCFVVYCWCFACHRSNNIHTLTARYLCEVDKIIITVERSQPPQPQQLLSAELNPRTNMCVIIIIIRFQNHL